MSKWTRRDLVKVGLAASAGSMISGGEGLAESRKGKASAAPAAARDTGPTNVEDANGLRERLSMDFGWRFALGNACDPEKDFGFGKLREMGTFAKAGKVGGPADPKFDDSAWKQVQLPHDWAVELPFVDNKDLVMHGAKPLGREYPATSVGWYRKEFVLPASDSGKNITVVFDGMFRNAMVFFNGHYLATNMSGYAPLALDLSDFANFGSATAEKPGEEPSGKNVLVVRVDASLDEGWFYEGAGIYRHVWLIKASPVHLAEWGTFVRPAFGGAVAVADGDELTVLVSNEVANDGNSDVLARVRTALIEPSGKTVATAVSDAVVVAARDVHRFESQATVAHSRIWSLETPNLYRAVSTVDIEGKIVDQDVNTFGIRTLHFDADKGFFLNGKPVKVKGTCNHQDHAGVGEAIPDRLQSYRLERLRWMGSNACRTSHNAPTPEFLDACDRMGMLVMDETRMMSSSPEGLSELERLIKRDRNHPSVFIWSLGNEEPEQGNTRGERIVLTMRTLQRKLDPSRDCTTAMNNGYGGDGVSNVVDVQGFNYNDGKIDDFHRAHPKLPIIGTETASTLATRGIYANDPAKGYVSAYDTQVPYWGNTAEQWWTFYDQRPWLAGGFVWTGFDYRGEPTPYKWPCISSQFGNLDTCGFAKDTAYYYKAWWGAEPVLHLLPHWNWEGKEGQEIDVWAYSNLDSVELFLNGQSLGSQAVKKNGHLEWKVKYAPGTLEARASKHGKVVLTDKRETTGPATKIVATADRNSILADGQDVSVINVSIVDAQGRTVPNADNKVTFAASGPAEVIGVGNGDPSSHEPDKASERSAFNGLCMAIVQGKRGQPGAVTVALSAPGLEGVSVAITTSSGEMVPIVE